MNSFYFIPISFDDVRLSQYASERYRVLWPSQYLDNSKVWKQGDDALSEIKNSKCLVLQKVCNPQVHEFARFARANGVLVIYDLADPIWISNEYFFEIERDIDLFTVSSPMLRRGLHDITNKPVYVVDDGENLSTYKKRKTNYSLLRDKPTISWTGYHGTYPNLTYALEILRELEGSIYVKVIADKPLEHNFKDVEFVPWSLEVANKSIIESDIFINPRDLSNPKAVYKSNNKTNLAWALGVPVIYKWDSRNVLEEMQYMISNEDIRRKNVIDGYKRVLGFYNINRVAKDYLYIMRYHRNEISFKEFLVYKSDNFIRRIRYGY